MPVTNPEYVLPRRGTPANSGLGTLFQPRRAYFIFRYLLGLYFLFPHAPLWVMLILGFGYSLMVNANINGVGHNFIHNPFFRSQRLNRLFGITRSNRLLFFADDVRRRAYATSQGELGPAGRKR